MDLSKADKVQSATPTGNALPAGKQPQGYRQRFRRTAAYEKLSLLSQNLSSRYHSRKYRDAFQDVKTYCLFIGHARSGHSIVGALLDAHPHAVVADELDTLLYVDNGFSKQQICTLVLERSQHLAEKGRKASGREGQVYSYFVPGQWQGRYQKLQVVGDTRAGLSTQRIGRDPQILQRLQKLMGNVDLKILHVLRNPFDNISTMMLRGGRSVDNATARYFANCDIIRDLRARVDETELLVVRHEALIGQPQVCVTKMCQFLGLEVIPDYVDACAGIIYDSPSKSRSKVEWDTESIDTVQRKIDKFEFLNGYSFTS